MAEPIPNFSLNEPYYRRVERYTGERVGAFFGATRTQVLQSWNEAKWQELLVGVGTGAITKAGLRIALSAAGAQGLPLAILVGAASGAAVSVIKERRRVGNFTDMDRGIILRGAVVGAFGGWIGAELVDWGVTDAMGTFFHDRWEGLRGVLSNLQVERVEATPTAGVTAVATETTAQPTVTPTVEPTPNPTAQPTAVSKPFPTPEPAAPIPEPQQPPTSGVPGVPEPIPTPQAPNLAEKLLSVEHNQKIETEVAKEVGRILAGVPESSPLHPQIQHILETQGHQSMMNALKQYIADHPNFDINNPADLQAAGDAAKATFIQDYNKKHLEDVINTLVHPAEATTAVVDTHQAAQEVTQFVSDNQTNHELFTDHVVARGETAGHLLQEMGVAPTWDGQDLHGFAALWFSNPEAFKDIASGMGLTPEELLKLMQQAQDGDMAAVQKVYKSMSLIKAGTHLKLPTHLLVDEMKRKLAYGG